MEITASGSHEVSSTTGCPLLPPCRVCEEKASGFHYGVNTCEACKGFFRRSLYRKIEYQCSGSNKCEIGPGKRNSCAKCRYEKCLSVGMSKQAIKTGRYTHEKRTRDIQEIKQIQKNNVLEREAKQGLDRCQELERMVDKIVQVHLQQTPLTKDFYDKLPQRQAKFLERKKLEEETFGQMKPIPREEYREFYEKTGIDVDGRRELIVSMIPYLEEGIRRFISLAKAVPGFKELPVDDQIGLLKKNKLECCFIVKHKLVNVELGVMSSPEGIHVTVEDAKKLEFYPVTDGFCDWATRLQTHKLSAEEICAYFSVALLSGANKTECGIIIRYQFFNPELGVASNFGPMDVSLEDLRKLEFFQMSEVMFRKAGVLQKMNLKLEDSMALFGVSVLSGGARFEVWLMTMFNCFNATLNTFTVAGGPYSGGTVHKDDICKCYDAEFIESLFQRADEIQKFNLSEAEVNALKAVILLFTDRCELEYPERVESYQLIMVEALQHLIKKNHPEDPLLFPRLMVFLMDLRSLTELHAKNIEKVHLEFNDIQFPPLLYEML